MEVKNKRMKNISHMKQIKDTTMKNTITTMITVHQTMENITMLIMLLQLKHLLINKLIHQLVQVIKNQKNLTHQH
jgi:hypothetical protein